MAPIQSQNLRSICGYWTRPILGLKVNHKFNDKLRSELADHGGYLTVFRQLRSQGSVFLVVYSDGVTQRLVENDTVTAPRL